MSLERQIGAGPASYVAEVARRGLDVIGDRLVGMWLFGSATLGDFEPGRSDIDIQGVTATRLPLGEREQLVAAMSHDALPCPARGLEFVLYTRDDLDDPLGPAFQLNLNTGERMEHHIAFDPGEDPRYWFVIDASIGRQHGMPLHGPPPESVFREPAHDLLVDSLKEALDWYADHGGDAVATILGACRTWAFAADGRWRSKADSARWARARLADPGPIDRALRLRDGAHDPPLSRREVSRVLRAARVALDRSTQ